MTNFMNLLGISLASILLIGCAAPRRTMPEKRATPPVISVTGAPVMLVNVQHGFVVLDYSSRVMPAVGARLGVYRAGQRVGVVQITEPVRPRYATADVLEGTLQVGDEAR